MINPHRGEVELVINGKPLCLCLTLGALARLEQGFGVGNLVDLADYFEQGALKSQDLSILLEAGLYGGGNPLSASELELAHIEGGIVGAISAVKHLIALTFGETNHDGA